MTTKVLITVDTELSALLYQRGADARANFEASVLGCCAEGAFGIGWQIEQLDRFGLKAVFFVDPMPVLVYGDDCWLRETVEMILARGHEVQLHIHTEWLEWSQIALVGDRRGRNLADFCVADQINLLTTARDILTKAGAPYPTAFRAGNFGANNDSIAALAALGIGWDSSFNRYYVGNPVAITMDTQETGAIMLGNVAELPISGLLDRPGQFRPAQICAISSAEMRASFHHAVHDEQPFFNLVTHSFEMLSRDRSRPNRLVMQRFSAMCRAIAEHPSLTSVGFNDLDPAEACDLASSQTLLAPKISRTVSRMVQQLWGNWRYERQLRPA